MKRVVPFVLVLGLAGCGASPDEMVKESLRCWEEAAEILESIQDADAAKAAEPQLRALVKRMGELNRQAQQQEMPPEQMTKLQTDNEEAGRKVLARVHEASKKAAEIPGCADVVYRFNRLATLGRALP